MDVRLSVLFGTDRLGFRLRDWEAAAYIVEPQAIEAIWTVKADGDGLETALVTGGSSRQVARRRSRTRSKNGIKPSRPK